MLRDNGKYDTFKVLAIDPGLNNSGIAILTIQVNPPKIISISATTLKAERLIDDCSLDDEDYIEQIHKRYRMCEGLRTHLKAHDPCHVVSESPFFDRRKPGSFIVLAEVLVSLLDTVVEYNPLIQTSKVEPLLVKKILGVAGQKGKEVVREAMEKVEAITDVLQDPLDTLDEHAVDAIGVGYTWFLRRSNLLGESK